MKRVVILSDDLIWKKSVPAAFVENPAERTHSGDDRCQKRGLREEVQKDEDGSREGRGLAFGGEHVQGGINIQGGQSR